MSAGGRYQAGGSAQRALRLVHRSVLAAAQKCSGLFPLRVSVAYTNAGKRWFRSGWTGADRRAGAVQSNSVLKRSTRALRADGCGTTFVYEEAADYQ